MSDNFGERMARLEEKTDNIDKKVDGITTTLNDFIKTADERFAPKWVADAIKFIIAAVVLAILGALMMLILK